MPLADYEVTNLPDPRNPRSVKVRLYNVVLRDSEHAPQTQYLRFQWRIIGTRNYICTFATLMQKAMWVIREHCDALKHYHDEYPTGLVLNDDVLEWFKKYEGKECFGELRWHHERWELKGLRHKRTGLLNKQED